MPLIAVAAQNYMLDRMWSAAPDTPVEVGLLSGDPRAGGVELAATGGYARYTVGTWGAFWTAAADGVKQSIEFDFPMPTDAWPVAAAWEGIYVDGVLWDAAPLLEPVVVTGPGSGVTLRLSRHFNALS